MDPSEREQEWAGLLQAAIKGDEHAYRRFLQSVSAVVRSAVRRRASGHGIGAGDVEDVVQETLLAIHLKRHTWAEVSSIGSWIAAITRNKLVDALRRRGRRAEVSLADLGDTLPFADPDPGFSRSELDRMFTHLKTRQQEIVRSVSIDGYSVRETAERLAMTEVAVRVALHRALKALSAIYRRQGP